MAGEPKSATQFEIEIAKMMIRRQAPRDVYLEIGGKFGGSLNGFGREMNPGATLISVDLPAGSAPKGEEAAARLRGTVASLKADGYDAHVIFGDSTAPDTIDAVWQAVGAQQKVDVLFIDGSHKLLSVAKDAANYVRFVRPGGLVIFHDCGIRANNRIHPDAGRNMQGIHSVWQDVAYNRRHMLVGEWCGYGLVWK